MFPNVVLSAVSIALCKTIKLKCLRQVWKIHQTATCKFTITVMEHCIHTRRSFGRFLDEIVKYTCTSDTNWSACVSKIKLIHQIITNIYLVYDINGTTYLVSKWSCSTCTRLSGSNEEFCCRHWWVWISAHWFQKGARFSKISFFTGKAVNKILHDDQHLIPHKLLYRKV